MLYLCYLCRFKPLRDHLRGFLIAAWAGDKIAEFSFPEISFHFPLRPWFFFVSPAYAGKSHSYLNSTFLNLGSPPRMRGKVIHSLCDRPQRGITPAYAGKRRACWWTHRRTRDHPRVCGEKVSAIHRESASLGSPPRMRGKVTSGMLFLAFIGITPAYAGKRQMARKAGRTKPDHPRVCGEKPLPDPERIFQVGSPPRMRGKVPPHCCFCPAHGITPAYAGKSLWLFCCVSLPSDHPRVCGEKSQSTSASRRALGSPPRMRGKVCMATGLRVSDGITPAYAGKRPGHIPHREREQDHPRVCGEKIQHPKYTTDKGGSPPRMRGKD